MFKKIILIIFLLSGYIYLVSSDPNGNLLYKAKKTFYYFSGKYKDMNVQYQVKKWPNSNSKKRY
ncbi:MAG: hypothetical protein JXA94_01555 [Parachlamydiales bacterium]|nr:hypothetical protein [Parachlamydiales bacterium]